MRSVVLLTALFVSGMLSDAFAQPNESWYAVRAFGAVADGETKDTEAIQRAIDACHEWGGGTVYFSPGTYLSGTVRLKDGVTLHLDSGAVLKGSPDDSDYDPYEELGFPNDADRETSFFHFALVRAEDAQNIGIEGRGTIDGNRPKRFGPKPIALKRCQNVRIIGITLVNAPNYNISLLGTDNVLIDGVTIRNGYADGIDPDSCRNVRIANCHIESADDAIVLKTSFSLGERRSCENITITNCYLATKANAFKCGTESGGDFKRIALSNCVMDMMPNGSRPATSGVALESVDGAVLEDVAIANVTMVNVRSPIFIRLGNRGRDMDVPTPGAVRRVNINNVVASRASLPCIIAGIPGHNVEDVVLSQIRVQFAGGTVFAAPDAEIPEQVDAYPEARMFGLLPSYALYARHVRNLSIEGFYASFDDGFWRITGEKEEKGLWRVPEMVPELSEKSDPGYALYFDDVKILTLRGLVAASSPAGAPLIRLTNTPTVLISDAIALPNTKTFVEVKGEKSSNILITASELSAAEQAVVCREGVAADAVRLVKCE